MTAGVQWQTGLALAAAASLSAAAAAAGSTPAVNIAAAAVAAATATIALNRRIIFSRGTPVPNLNGDTQTKIGQLTREI
jgi:hypothetical protein